jgi:hypothetical protein
MRPYRHSKIKSRKLSWAMTQYWNSSRTNF